MPAEFWDDSDEETEPYYKVKKDDLETHLNNIYKLRCSFVHNAEPFNYYLIIPPRNGEVQVGQDIRINGIPHTIIPSVKWFERLVNSVLLNTLKQFSTHTPYKKFKKYLELLVEQKS